MALLAHPRPGSLNHALAGHLVRAMRDAGARVVLHDLYAERFDPILRADEAHTSGEAATHLPAVTDDPLLAQHREELKAASALVVVHPNWWGKPPAILAGWMDRVPVPGVAYRLDDGADGTPRPLLSLQQMLIVNTSDTPEERDRKQFGDPLEQIWARCLAPYLGNPHVDRVVLRVVADADADQRADWLAQVTDHARRLVGALTGEQT